MIDPDKTLKLRIEYAERPLDESLVSKDPLAEFSLWFEEAIAAQIPLANAMTLATVSPTGKPSLRVVLLKQADETGFIFFTNYESRKGRELSSNPHAALNFFWPELERQVRIEGTISRVSEKECDEYFASRPRGSQIGAWASHQSELLSSRKELEEIVDRFELQFNDKPIPRPPNWGGYRLRPESIEFWQGRANRLHDRIIYTLQSGNPWKIHRLYP